MKRWVKNTASICSVTATAAAITTTIGINAEVHQQQIESTNLRAEKPGQIRNYRTYDSNAQWKLDAGTKPTNANYLLTTEAQYKEWGLPWDATKTAANQPCLLGFTVASPNATLSYYKFPQDVLIDLVIPDTVTLGTSTYNITTIGTWNNGGEAWGLFAWSGQATTTAGTARYTSTGAAVVSTRLCLSLRSIVINDKIESLPKRCFYGCENLQNIWIGKNLDLKGTTTEFNNKLQNDYYFCHCPNLRLPSTDSDGNYIKGTGVMADPTNLNLRTYYSSVNGVEGLAITLRKNSDTSRNDHDTVDRIYPGLAIGGVNAESIWATTSIIPTWSFETCWALTHVNIGDVKTIEVRAFGNCLNLAQVYTNWTVQNFIDATTNSGKVFTTYDPDKNAGNKDYSTASTVGHTSFADTNDNIYTVLYLQPGITETNLQTAWDNNSSNKQKFLLRNTAENRQILSLMIPETITITPPSVEKTFYSAIGGTILLVANVGGSTGVDKDYPQDVKWAITSVSPPVGIDFIDPYNGVIKVDTGLVVGTYEFTVTATSQFATSISGTCDVTITIVDPSLAINGPSEKNDIPVGTSGQLDGYSVEITPSNFSYDNLTIESTTSEISILTKNDPRAFSLEWTEVFASLGSHDVNITVTMTYNGNVEIEEIKTVTLGFVAPTIAGPTSIGIDGADVLNVPVSVAYNDTTDSAFIYTPTFPQEYTGDRVVKWELEGLSPENLKIDQNGHIFVVGSGLVLGEYNATIKVTSQIDSTISATKQIKVIVKNTTLAIAGEPTIDVSGADEIKVSYIAERNINETKIVEWTLGGAPSWISITPPNELGNSELIINIKDVENLEAYYDFVITTTDEYGNTASKAIRLVTGVLPPETTVHADHIVVSGVAAGAIAAFALLWFLLLLLWKRHGYAVLYRKGKKVKVVVYNKRKHIVGETKEYAAGETMKSGAVHSIARDVNKIIDDKKHKLSTPVMCSHEKEDIEIMADIRKPIHDGDTKTRFCRIKFVKDYKDAKWEKDNKNKAKSDKNKKKPLIKK